MRGKSGAEKDKVREERKSLQEKFGSDRSMRGGRMVIDERRGGVEHIEVEEGERGTRD